jgi:DNA-binding beta-propeller fold protein YncE
VVSRRACLFLPALAAACSRRSVDAFRGYAFIANQEGRAVAALDLEVMAVARHIGLDDAPTQILATNGKPLVYALTPDTGAVHEIQVYRLSFARKTAVASSAVAMALSPDERSLYVLARNPRSLVALGLDTFRPEWQLALPEEPMDFAVAPAGEKAAISSAGGVWLADTAARRLTGQLASGDFGGLRFLSNGKMLIAANRGERVLSLFDVASGKLITHLPLSMRPDYLCFSPDGGQLFVTGDGLDGVVIVYPFQTEVAETVLAGHVPGAMAASSSYLFVANPLSGGVSILSTADYKLMSLVQTGADPGYVALTPDEKYALVLNRKSGDVAVLDLRRIKRNKSAGLLTVIPVGSRPVSAAVRSV